MYILKRTILLVYLEVSADTVFDKTRDLCAVLRAAVEIKT